MGFSSDASATRTKRVDLLQVQHEVQRSFALFGLDFGTSIAREGREGWFFP